MQVMLGVTSGEELDNLHINLWHLTGYFSPTPLGPGPQSGSNIDPRDVTLDEHGNIRRSLQIQLIYLRQR